MGECELCSFITPSKRLVKIQKGNGIIRYICLSCYNSNVSGSLRYLRLTNTEAPAQVKLITKKER